MACASAYLDVFISDAQLDGNPVSFCVSPASLGDVKVAVVFRDAAVQSMMGKRPGVKFAIFVSIDQNGEIKAYPDVGRHILVQDRRDDRLSVVLTKCGSDGGDDVKIEGHFLTAGRAYDADHGCAVDDRKTGLFARAVFHAGEM